MKFTPQGGNDITLKPGVCRTQDKLQRKSHFCQTPRSFCSTCPQLDSIQIGFARLYGEANTLLCIPALAALPAGIKISSIDLKTPGDLFTVYSIVINRLEWIIQNELQNQ